MFLANLQIHLNVNNLQENHSCNRNSNLAVALPQIAEDLVRCATFRPQDMKKQRESSKTKAEEGRQKKEEENENPHPFGGVFSWPILRFSTKNCPPVEVLPK